MKSKGSHEAAEKGLERAWSPETSEWTQFPCSPAEKPGEYPRTDPEVWGVEVQVGAS